MTTDPSAGSTVYRGVPKSHPGYAAALNGEAFPRGGEASIAEHNDSNTNSRYTSWSTLRWIAERYAEGGGVVLEVNLSEISGRWFLSPDRYYENEVLIEGPIVGARIVQS